MRRGVFAAALQLLVAQEALAEPVTIWVADAPPSERLRQRADLQTGGTRHLWSVDLRFPPEPETADDQAAYDALRRAWEAGRERWDDFDVELPIAREIEEALNRIRLVRGPDDVDDLVKVLHFQGTAVARAFDPAEFALDSSAAPYRTGIDGAVIPTPWLRAWALSGRKAERADLVDGTAWLDWQRYATALDRLVPARLEIPEGIGQVVVDGVPVAPGTLELRPGRHWVHVVRGGVIHGRSVLDVTGGHTYALPTPVDDLELAEVRTQVLAGRRGGWPEDVAVALQAITRQYGGPVYLAVADGERPVLLALTEGAVLKDTRLVTFTLFGEVGAGALGTTMFDQKTVREAEFVLDGVSSNASGVVRDPNADSMEVAGAAFAGLGVELGVSYFAMALGLDAAFTPTRTVDYVIEAPGEHDAHRGHASVFPQPWLGIGAYAVRPTKPTPVVSLMGTVGYYAPAHIGYGGRLTIGFPLDDQPSWIRLVLGGTYAPDTFRDVDGAQPLFTGWLRLGFGANP